MKVFVVYEYMGPDGEAILGVFNTKSAAKAAVQTAIDESLRDDPYSFYSEFACKGDTWESSDDEYIAVRTVELNPAKIYLGG